MRACTNIEVGEPQQVCILLLYDKTERYRTTETEEAAFKAAKKRLMRLGCSVWCSVEILIGKLATKL